MSIGIVAALLCAVAACAPDAESELAHGKRLLNGDAGVPTDARAAAVHLRVAADRHLPAAAYHLGLLLRRGAAGVPVDLVAARRWLGEAAAAELPEAQFMLGQMLVAAEGGPADPEMARRWFERAAEHDSAEANFELAMAYRRGDLGVRADANAA
ncbi:MAG: tetratricopeptide repeat protein, partial [Burkholderiales bacterium]